MTISIKIQNTDTRDNAIVVVKTMNKGRISLMPIVNHPGTQLKGGESTVEYIYDGQSLLIEEVQNG